MAEPGDTNTSTRKLVRLPDDGHIAGVCAGLARFLNVDPLLVRIAAFILLISGPGFFLYLAAWIFVPSADGTMLVEQVKPLPEDKHTQVVGIVLIASAIIVLSGGWWWSPTRHWLVPLGLIGLGGWRLLRKDRDDGRPDPTSVVPEPPAPSGTTEAPTGSAPSTDEDVTDAEADAADTTSVFASPLAGDGDGPPPPDDAPTAAVPIPPPAHLEPTRRRRRFLGPLVLGALLIWGGAAWLGGVQLQDGLAIALVILGGGFVLGAFVGGSRALVFPAFVVGAALVFTSIVDIPWAGGIGDRRWEVDEASDLRGDYEVGIGQGTLDLTELTLGAGRHREVHASVGIGELRVIVPDDLNLEVTTHVGAGDIDVLGRHDEGVGVDLDRDFDGSSRSGTIELDLEVGLGHIEVRAA
jgi:phage shock protein PspC (stress-responsive transcriptional regulator)